MSKKVISVLLTAAMLVAMLCVGVGAVTASADTVTYYFLAPDEYFATNSDVGYYYWAPEENAAWPGLAMTPAPEVGPNVFKCEAPDMDSTSTIIFNAFVDAGDPADPELAKHAHQTVNINTEGYLEGESAVYDSLGMELDNFYGMIYVLNNNDKSINDLSGAVTTNGEWFSIDPSAPNYYKNFEEYYGTYNSGTTPDDTDTDSEPAADTDSEVPGDKTYHVGDTVTCTLYLQNLPNASGYGGSIFYNTDVLKRTSYTGAKQLGTLTSPDIDFALQNESTKGKFDMGEMFDPYGNENGFAQKGKYAVVEFEVIAECTEAQMGLDYIATEILGTNFTDQGVPETLKVFTNYDLDKDLVAGQAEYTYADWEIVCTHEVPGTDTDTDSEPDTDSDPSSATSSNTPSDTSSKTPSDTSSKTPSNTSSNTSSKNTNDNASKKTSGTTSTKTGTTTGTVQTAGTFAVVSLVVILMAAGAVVLYTRKKTEE